MDYTCKWPSVFLLVKPYVPSSQNNSDLAAPQGINIVKLSLDNSKKEPQILQIQGSFKSLSNISVSPEINHLSLIGLTEDNHIILYRINILSLKIVKQTSLSDMLELFAYDQNIDLELSNNIQWIKISCDLLPSIILIVTPTFFACIYAPNS